MSDLPYTPPSVKDRATKPSGVLPKYAQATFIAGVSLVMVIVIAFSGRNAPPERPPAPARSSIVDPNGASIQDLQRRIDEQMQNVAAQHAKRAQAQGNANVLPGYRDPLLTPNINSQPATGVVPYDGAALPSGAVATGATSRGSAKGDRSPLRASNIALSHRDSGGATGMPSHSPVAPVNKTTPDATEVSTDKNLHQSVGKTYRLLEGTVLETALVNRLDASFSGPVDCQVTSRVFSHDHQTLLIPQGSRVLGEVKRVESFGQQRVAIAFHRLIMPDGYSVSLDKQPGLSQQGETGLVDQVSRHLVQVFGVSLAVGAIAGLSQANTQYGTNVSATDAYRQGVATSLSQSSLNILDRYLNVLPTFTIREGYRVKVYLTGDLMLPAYANHRMPADL